ncbi:MAG: hypothetical protein ABI580_07450 [Burkholderiaceae bacterium]
MEKSQATQVTALPQSCNPVLTLGGRVRQGTTLTVLAVAAVGAGLIFGWESLAALGLTTFIVALLPCLVMCAAGICAHRMGRKDAGAGTTTQVVPPKEAQFPAQTPLGGEASAIEKATAPMLDTPAR